MSYLMNDEDIDELIIDNVCNTDALVLELFISVEDNDLCAPRWRVIEYLNKNYPHLTEKYFTLKILV